MTTRVDVEGMTSQELSVYIRSGLWSDANKRRMRAELERRRERFIRHHIDHNTDPYWSVVERTPDGFQRVYADTEPAA